MADLCVRLTVEVVVEYLGIPGTGFSLFHVELHGYRCGHSCIGCPCAFLGESSVRVYPYLQYGELQTCLHGREERIFYWLRVTLNSTDLICCVALKLCPLLRVGLSLQWLVNMLCRHSHCGLSRHTADS